MNDDTRALQKNLEPSEAGFRSIPTPTRVLDECECDVSKIHYQAQVDFHAANEAYNRDIRKMEEDTERTLIKGFHEALVDVSKTSITGATTRAESVRTAAGTIGVIYTGVLGLTFSVSDNPLPPRGLIPAVFLGVSIVMATAYIAYPIEPVSTTDWPQGGRSTPEDREERTTAFMEWAAAAVRTGGYALRAAVVALGFGVAFLPIGFLSLGSSGVERDLTTLRPSWPPTPDQVSDASLQALLYEAQVKETADFRRVALEARPAESWTDWRVKAVYAAAIVALLLTFLHPLLLRLIRRMVPRLPMVIGEPRPTSGQPGRASSGDQGSAS